MRCMYLSRVYSTVAEVVMKIMSGGVIWSERILQKCQSIFGIEHVSSDKSVPTLRSLLLQSMWYMLWC